MIAYATFQAQAEQVAQFLTSHGIRAAAYHAGKHMKARLLASLWSPELRQAPHMLIAPMRQHGVQLTGRDGWYSL